MERYSWTMKGMESRTDCGHFISLTDHEAAVREAVKAEQDDLRQALRWLSQAVTWMERNHSRLLIEKFLRAHGYDEKLHPPTEPC